MMRVKRSAFLISTAVVLLLLLPVCGVFAIESYLDNGIVKVGVDPAKGGSITYLSKSGTNDNLINNHDLGRQIQQSYYSGPQPYNPSNNAWVPPYTNWPWNPIQSGDIHNHTSQILAQTNDGQTLYVKCRPLQWALNNVPGECTFESWISLAGNVVVVSNRLINARTDTAQQFSAQDQELPAVYTIGRLYRMFSYAGNAPFTGGAVTNLPAPGPPTWNQWRATESWAAMVDVNNWGIGVYQPNAVRFLGGFNGTPGSGGPTNDATGYLSSLHQEILDSNITYTYTYSLILGTVTEIRNWVYAQPYRPACNFVFDSDRKHWSYGLTTDNGWPLTNNRIRVSLFSSDPQLHSPVCAFAATNVPNLYLRAAYSMANPAGRNVGQLFWETNSTGGYAEARSISFNAINDGQFHIYELNLAASNTYSGLITQLRFDPAFSGDTNDYVDIAWISSSPFANNAAVKPLLNIVQTNANFVIGLPIMSGSSAGYVGKNLLYDLESCTNLTAGTWQGVTGATNLIGNNTVKTITNAPAAIPMYFRLKARLQ